MTDPTKDISGINDRIADGRAVVWSLANLLEHQQANLPLSDVDIVTVAFPSGMAGCAAMLCVPVAGRGVFTRAEEIWLNGVEGRAGPAPNERLGVVDTMIIADTEREGERVPYNGAQLLYDLIDGATVSVECHAVEGSRHTAEVSLTDLEFARFYVYNAFVDADLPCSVLQALGRGSRLLLNGAQGIIVGRGTRDSAARPAWSLCANMQDMNASLMKAPDGGEIRNMIAVAIPVLNQAVREGLLAWGRSRSRTTIEAAAFEQVKTKILDGEFTLTDTDFPI